MNTQSIFRGRSSMLPQLVSFGLLALLAFASQAARGNDFVAFTSKLPPTFAVAAGSTNTALASSNVVFSVAAGTKAAVQMTHKLTGAGTSPVVWRFDASNDKVRWKPSAYSISVTPAGTAERSDISNFDVGSILYLRLSACENPNAAAVTNIVGNASTKKGS